MLARSALVPFAFLAALAVGCQSTSTPDARTPVVAGDPTDKEPPGGTSPGHREAIEACKGKKADDACNWSHDGKDRTGTCRTRPNETELACHGDRGGPPGGAQSGGTPK